MGEGRKVWVQEWAEAEIHESDARELARILREAQRQRGEQQGHHGDIDASRADGVYQEIVGLACLYEDAVGG